jgi:hypothetical protein
MIREMLAGEKLSVANILFDSPISSRKYWLSAKDLSLRTAKLKEL